ncbi:MAG: YjbH domain-containing protein [Candidatus Cloacimonetes bacterium]|nr:YjbH domain-containing protein [Candidatus Cloacimonadota bacterium]
MKRLLLFIFFCMLISLNAYEMDMLVDAPTAGILQRGEASLFTEFYKDNGMLVGMRLGLFPRFVVGMSYGAENVVGNQKPDWHDRVEFQGKFRLLDESYSIPALAIGFDSQGHGRFYIEDNDGNELRRYDIKSKGFYLVASKNFEFIGNLGTHLGCNYSLENTDDSRHLNIFAGVDKMIGDVLVATVEYDMGLNDNSDWLESTLEENFDNLEKGYLNAGMGIYFSSNFLLQLKFNDLLQNRSDTQAADRSLNLRYYFDYRDDN